MTKVLIVDDDELVLKTLEMALKRHDFEVETAKDGKEAISKFEASKYDVVLSDIKMPGGINGVEVLNRLDKNTKGVLMTGHYGEFINGHFCIYKPFDMDVLINAVSVPSDQSV